MLWIRVIERIRAETFARNRGPCSPCLQQQLPQILRRRRILGKPRGKTHDSNRLQGISGHVSIASDAIVQR